MTNDPTIMQGRDLDDPEQVKIIITKMLEQIAKLETDRDDLTERVVKAETFLKPFRWVFNKVAAGAGFAIVAVILTWFGLG